MKKVQFFSDSGIQALQLQVNNWLAEHKNISIMDTNMTCVKDEVAFYILYNIRRTKTQRPLVAENALHMPVQATDIDTSLPAAEN